MPNSTIRHPITLISNMPKRTRSRLSMKSRKRRRSVNRRRKPRRNYGGNPMVLYRAPVPTSKKVTMRYVDHIQLDPGVLATYASQRYRANSVFDPDYDNVGHQPLGFDQWTVFYNHYCVIKANINIQAVNHDNAHASIVGLKVDDDTNLATTLTPVLEAPYCAYGILSQEHGSQNPLKLSNSVAPLKFLKKKFNDPDVRCAVGQNPLEPVFFHIFSQTADNSTTDPAPIDIWVTIDYTVVFTEPKTLESS